MTDIEERADSQNPALWDDVARQYSAEPDAGEMEIAAELTSLLDSLDVRAGSTLLEAGCGSGQISSHLASRGYDTTLLDFSSVALEKAGQLYKMKNLDGKFVHGDLFELDKSADRHDVVWNSGVLEHFDGWQMITAMQQMASVAEKFVIFLVPNPSSPAYMNFRRKALSEGSWQWGLEILRESLDDLVLLAGLEMVEQRLVGRSHLEYFEGFAAGNAPQDAGLPEQNYLRVIVARHAESRMDQDSRAALLLKVFRADSAALRRTYNHDASVMLDSLRSLGVKAAQDEERMASLEADLDHFKFLTSNLQGDLSYLKKSLDFEKHRVDTMLNSKTWKLTRLYERRFQGNLIGRLIEGLASAVLRQDSGAGPHPDSKSHDAAGGKGRPDIISKIKSITEKHRHAKGIIVYPPVVDWNIPQFQRPQHMAQNLARNGWLYFYCTTNTYDSVRGFEEISENLYLTDSFGELTETLESFFMFVHCADPNLTASKLGRIAEKSHLVYDYLDEIHPDVSGLRQHDVMDRHTYMMKNSTAVIATAQKLFSDAAEHRKTGIHLIPNAADYDHFHRERNPNTIPRVIRAIQKSSRPILGYFGALAKWFDYDLVKDLAENHPEWSIVLIGWDYDDTVRGSGIGRLGNIHYLGVKEYDRLPDYAVWFDVCILPFLINEITNSTSPIKLFEYMALGRPIVTTPIREAGRYKSPLVAGSATEFAKKIEQALDLRNDPEYLGILDAEAKENTWKKRFDDLDRILVSLSGRV